MAFFNRENEADRIRKELGGNLQNLSEQIGKLQQELASKNAELDQLRQQASQGQQAEASASAREKQLEEQANQHAMELALAQSRLRELEAQLAQASSYPQPPTAAAQPGTTTPTEPTQSPGQAAQPSGTPGLAVGSTAYVAQAGGLPLRLRSHPGLDKDSVIDRLQPGTQMTLLEGPQDRDGYSWWRIRTSDGREGWVAGQDLRTQPE